MVLAVKSLVENFRIESDHVILKISGHFKIGLIFNRKVGFDFGKIKWYGLGDSVGISISKSGNGMARSKIAIILQDVEPKSLIVMRDYSLRRIGRTNSQKGGHHSLKFTNCLLHGV